MKSHILMISINTAPGIKRLERAPTISYFIFGLQPGFPFLVMKQFRFWVSNHYKQHHKITRLSLIFHDESEELIKLRFNRSLTVY